MNTKFHQGGTTATIVEPKLVYAASGHFVLFTPRERLFQNTEVLMRRLVSLSPSLKRKTASDDKSDAAYLFVEVSGGLPTVNLWGGHINK